MNTITIYSTSICPACSSLKKWLDKQDVQYESKITDMDESIMSEFISLNDGAISVPFSVVKNSNGDIIEKISGFDKAKFKRILLQ